MNNNKAEAKPFDLYELAGKNVSVNKKNNKFEPAEVSYHCVLSRGAKLERLTLGDN
jgi:hypothetical protein